MAQANNTKVLYAERWEVREIPRSILFGLISWTETVEVKKLETRISILSDSVHKVFLNGVEMKPVTSSKQK
jgi:hypothetical protein